MNKTILPIKSLGYQQITSLSSATALTIPDGATMAVVQPQTQSVRYRDDGTAPTASVGMVITAGTSVPFYNLNSNLKFIEATSGAVLNITYYGE